MNLRLQEIVKQIIPDFNPEVESDLIKAEKILKAHSKTDESISQNDIENFLIFFKEKGNKYREILADENLSKIINGEIPKIDSSKNKVHHISQEIKDDFSMDFSDKIMQFVKLSMQNNHWGNLRIFYKNYFSIINVENHDELLETISSKNDLILSIIPQRNQYKLFLNEYKFAINPDYFALQSDVDSHYFNEEILGINNSLSNHQKTEDYYKVFLGKIFIALNHFDAFTEDLRDILSNNYKVGKKWADKENKIFSKLGKSTSDIADKDYGNVAEWIIMGIFYAIISLGLYQLYSFNSNVFVILVVLELIVFAVANKSLNRSFEEQSKSKTDQSFRRKLKKISFKIFILQLYVFFAIIGLGIIGLLIAIGVGTGGAGFIGMIFLIRFIIKLVKKN